MCLVLGRMAGALAKVSAALLSSNILHLTVGWVPPTGTPLSLSSCTRSIMGMTLRSAWLRQMYSASQVDRAISVCRDDFHINGAPRYVMKYPDLDLAVLGSCMACSGSQFPLKSESAHTDVQVVPLVACSQ
jgi:hypothetical protein